MKYFMHSMLIMLLLCPNIINGQEDVTIRKKDLKNDKMGLKDAWKHVKTGDDYYLEKGVWFGSAYDEYIKAIAYNSENPELNYKAGVSALFSDRKDKAAELLLKSSELKPDVAEDIVFLSARALQYAGRYQEAADKFNEFINTGRKNKKEVLSLAGKYLEECKSAILITSDTIRVEFTNLGSGINSNSDDYSPVFSADGTTMYFASRRQLSKASTLYDDSKYDDNIYFTSLNSGKWAMPQPMGKTITTTFCEAPLYTSFSGEELYIYTGYENGGDIKVATNKNGSWKAPSRTDFNINTGSAESSFTITPSGNEIWYVTDFGKESLGGKDIFIIRKLNDKKWSKPENAGPAINTPYDEESVRFSGMGDTVWFGSKGHNSMGGYDIFYSVKEQTGQWSKAKNAGYPINTPWDELFFQPVTGTGSTFYFVSNRSGGMGGLDIYKAALIPPEPEPVVLPEPEPVPVPVIIRDTVIVIKEVALPPPPVDTVKIPEPPKELILFLIGKIMDSETGSPVMAKIDLIDLSTDHVISTTASSDVDGSYRIRLPQKKAYMVDLRANGFLSDMKRVNITEAFNEEVYNLDVSMIKVRVGRKVVLNNILFETGKSVLAVSSYAELDRLTGILEGSPEMKIEISGHTDNTGSLQLNLTLSEARAKSVVDYLVQKGINRTRLEYKGYGPQQPISDNTTSAGRAQNRRVEFKILEF